MKNSMDLFLLIGQSNMAGRGDIVDFTSVENVYSFDEKNNWIAAKHPLHYDKKSLVGVGPGLEFARNIYSKRMVDTPIGLIPSAMGGSKIVEWGKEGELYVASLNKTKLALDSGSLKAILWMQGESDSDDEVASFNYGNSLIDLIKNYRKDLKNENTPFFICEIPEFLIPKEYPYVKIINNEIKRVQTELSNIFLIKNNNWKHIGDFLHLDTESANLLGKEIANKYLEFLETVKEYN